MKCPNCGAEAPDGVRFCEVDGTPLQSIEELVSSGHVDRTGFGVCRCGAGPDAIDENGFCTECGIRRGMGLRDHIEIRADSVFAGVTDRGVRHSENQDDMALAIVQTGHRPCYIAVVCDGVSGSEGAASASSAAAKTACAALVRGIQNAPDAAIEALVVSAIDEANQAVCHLTYAHGSAKDPPETTIVAAVVIGRMAVIGWAGDSRAYWFTETNAAMITRDHSWVNDVVDAGLMTEADALKSPMAHAIVRCLGGSTSNRDEPLTPSIVTCDLPEGARLLLCSDGLWNYTATLDELSVLVRQGIDEDPQVMTEQLVKFAVDKGGRDNITAVVLTL